MRHAGEVSTESSDQAEAGDVGPADLARVKAIALDTNAFGSKQLNFGRLRDLVNRAARHGGLEVWVPECVLWEWAQHAAAEREAAVKSIQRDGTARVEVPRAGDRAIRDGQSGCRPWLPARYPARRRSRRRCAQGPDHGDRTREDPLHQPGDRRQDWGF